MVRNPEFFDRLRRDEQILVAGPVRYQLLLNSLSVGFKTLNIQRVQMTLVSIGIGQIRIP